VIPQSSRRAWPAGSPFASPRLAPSLWALPLGTAALLAACGNSDPNPPADVDCSLFAPTVLAPGEATVIDAAAQGCIRLPAAGSSGAEYLYYAGITEGNFSSAGTTEPFRLLGGPEGSATAARAPLAPLVTRVRSAPARAFHANLRRMERVAAAEAAAERARGGTARARVALPPPVVGEKRTFQVLASGSASGTQASDYVDVTATVAYVGSHAAVYLDDAAPSPTYAGADLQAIGSMFDDHLYPIDTTAFGRESDIDGNGLVLILLTDRVTKLVDCSNGSVVVGFFLPFDLSPSHVGSNAGEIFYGLVPDASCSISPDDARNALPPVVIHEFQHMISYNQHALVHGGNVEEPWLNEGLSSFAEELGGRLVPDAVCANTDCLTQFTLLNLDNAQSYLFDPLSHFLVGPDRLPLPLEEYGSGWLFIRWLADQYAAEQPLGTDLTRKLDQTSRTGVGNVTQATGAEFGPLVTRWQLANYLDDLDGFTPGEPQLQYTSWDFRATYASLHSQNPGLFPRVYPLEPPVAANGSYQESDTLRDGSGRHLLVDLPANAPAASLKLTGADGITALPADRAPFIGIVRIR
jgi:hypothetical protein